MMVRLYTLIFGPLKQIFSSFRSAPNATVAVSDLVQEVGEGDGEVQICVEIVNLPREGLETDLIVFLEAVDNPPKAGR